MRTLFAVVEEGGSVAEWTALSMEVKKGSQKIIWFFLVISIFVTAMMCLSQRNLVNSNLGSFYQAVEDTVANGENITQLLEGDFRLERSKNIEIIDNSTKYYFMAYQASLVAMLPKTESTNYCLLRFLLFFPLWVVFTEFLSQTQK